MDDIATRLELAILNRDARPAGLLTEALDEIRRLQETVAVLNEVLETATQEKTFWEKEARNE